MTRGLLFWILMLFWALSVLGAIFDIYPARYSYVSSLFLLVLFGLLGWDVYGPAVKGK